MFGAHLLHFLLRAILGRVRHRVTAIAIGLHVENDRPLAGTRPFYSQVGSSLDRTNIHTVDLDARNIERESAFREIGFCGRARNRCTHGVAVVLDDVDHRQLPQRCHVEAFVDLPLIGSAVTEIGQRDIVVVAVTIRES